MSDHTDRRPRGVERGTQSPPLHPLEIQGTPRRCYVAALVARLLHTGALLAAAAGLLTVTDLSLLLLVGGTSLAVLSWAAGRAWTQRAWAGLPAPAGPAVLPLTADRRFTAAAAVLLGAGAVAVSTLEPAGGFLAAMVGLDCAAAAADSFRRLAGRAPYPGRRTLALLTATAVSWTAALTLGGLSVAALLLACGTVAGVVAVGWGAVRLLRPGGRP